MVNEIQAESELEIEGEPQGARKDFLLQMYDQIMNDINRHLTFEWQAVTVVAGAFAMLALIEKQVVPPDIPVTIIVLLCGWMLAQVQDAAYWYNRNLLIIANIEKQFLKESDLRNIIYYFGKHRPANTLITHLRIQRLLGLSVLLIVMVYHFVTRALSGFSEPFRYFDPLRAMPYVVAVFALVVLMNLREKGSSDYREALRCSPGKTVATKGINYGGGHGHDEPIRLLSPFAWYRQYKNRKSAEEDSKGSR